MDKVLSIFLPEALESLSITAFYRSDKFARLLKWASRFSPIIAVDTANSNNYDNPRYLGINIDISGCERLFKGERNLIKQINRGINRLGFSAKIAIAPTLGAAWALSRYGSNSLLITSRDSLRRALQDLPVQALRISDETSAALHELNISAIHHLFSIPRSSLLARFNTELVIRLDQALGFRAEVIKPVTFIQPLKEKLLFNGPCEDNQAIKQATQALFTKLLAQLSSSLSASHKKLSQLILEITTTHAPKITHYITLCLPSYDYKHIWALLQTKLETLDVGLGITSITLSVTRTEEAQATHDNYLGQQDATVNQNSSNQKQELATLLDTLSAHLGPHGVLKLKCNQSYVPEKAFSYRPFSLESSKNTSFSVIHAKRPSILFHHAQQIRAMALMPDSPPFCLKWRNTHYQIQAGIGPERIAPEWWGTDLSFCETRDYFRVQVVPGKPISGTAISSTAISGTWLWIFRELNTSKWFLHGIWA